MRTIAILVSFALVACPCPAQTLIKAHDDYQRLYKAGQLDRFADSYACFLSNTTEAENVDWFVTFAEGGRLRASMKRTGQWNGLSKEDQDTLQKNALNVRFYSGGALLAEWRGLMLLGSKGRERNTWFSETTQDNGDKLRTTFSVDWRKLQFTWWVFPIPAPKPRVEVAPGIFEIPMAPETYGNYFHCEKIPKTIRQHG